MNILKPVSAAQASNGALLVGTFIAAFLGWVLSVALKDTRWMVPEFIIAGSGPVILWLTNKVFRKFKLDDDDDPHVMEFNPISKSGSSDDN